MEVMEEIIENGDCEEIGRRVLTQVMKKEEDIRMIKEMVEESE